MTTFDGEKPGESMARKKIQDMLKAGKIPTLETLLHRENVNLDELALDLVTHQIEIEVQSEQLRASNTLLERERQKFEAIFFGMPVAAMLINLETGMVEAENHKARKLFPERFAEVMGERYFRHFGENSFDQDRLALGLAECQIGQQAEIRAVSLSDRRKDSYLMVDVRMARLDINEDAQSCVLAMILPFDRRS
jgi:PAS domain-containing protein